MHQQRRFCAESGPTEMLFLCCLTDYYSGATGILKTTEGAMHQQRRFCAESGRWRRRAPARAAGCFRWRSC